MTADAALVELLRELRSVDYRFITVTPATHELVIAREFAGPATLRDIFGWNRPFAAADIDPHLLDLLQQADALEPQGARLKSRVRVSSLDTQLFVHSAFPTDDRNAVFFGPDTYRFVQFVSDHICDGKQPEVIADMGTGSGAAGIIAAKLCPTASIKLVDASANALRFARVNAAAAGVAAEFIHDEQMPSDADLVIANPPYLMDEGGRTYRDGGDLLGGRIALDWTEQALARLRPGGRLLLYTGAAFVADKSPLLEALEAAAAKANAHVEIEEIDPDVFGEELGCDLYRDVERIAAIGAAFHR